MPENRDTGLKMIDEPSPNLPASMNITPSSLEMIVFGSALMNFKKPTPAFSGIKIDRLRCEDLKCEAGTPNI